MFLARLPRNPSRNTLEKALSIIKRIGKAQIIRKSGIDHGPTTVSVTEEKEKKTKAQANLKRAKLPTAIDILKILLYADGETGVVDASTAPGSAVYLREATVAPAGLGASNQVKKTYR